MTHDSLGRYSYMSAEPFCELRIDKSNPLALQQLAAISQKYFQPRLHGLPPMQGGWLGWFGYELGQCFERTPSAKFNEFRLPSAALGLYDVILSWDHATGQGWIISQGWPARNLNDRERRAYRRLQHMMSILESPPPQPAVSSATVYKPLHPSRLAPQFPSRWSSDWTSNFASSDYRAAVARCVDYIHAGDIFQVNLSQRLLRSATCPSADLYRHLRHQSPAPFAGYADFGRTQVISTSPERFLSLQDRQLETRPIKGTRPRLSDPLADAGMGQLLRASEKDRSENAMIVDLLRNDLSRVADPDSIQVTQLCGLEQYRHVWHLVSVIVARLASQYSAVDVIAATFPGGSITGAPKVRAMEIIAELEPTARGPYCGSLGYLSFAGDMDLSILIRTVTASEGWWQVPVGGGIVADSSPSLEEQESWHKAEGILRAIDSLPTGPSK